MRTIIQCRSRVKGRYISEHTLMSILKSCQSSGTLKKQIERKKVSWKVIWKYWIALTLSLFPVQDSVQWYKCSVSQFRVLGSEEASWRPSLSPVYFFVRIRPHEEQGKRWFWHTSSVNMVPGRSESKASLINTLYTSSSLDILSISKDSAAFNYSCKTFGKLLFLSPWFAGRAFRNALRNGPGLLTLLSVMTSCGDWEKNFAREKEQWQMKGALRALWVGTILPPGHCRYSRCRSFLDLQMLDQTLWTELWNKISSTRYIIESKIKKIQ